MMSSEKTLTELVNELFNISLVNLIDRFNSQGWRYQGRTNIGCIECGEDYEVFRKPYTTTKGDYEYWGIVCKDCETCTGLDIMDSLTKKHFRDWSEKSDNAKENSTIQRDAVPLSDRPNVRGSGSLNPTGEQRAILDAVNLDSDLSIEALAGTGKTTTLKLLAEKYPKKKGVYVAFNKSIVDEAKSKFPSSVACSTAHGLAYRAVGRNYATRLHANQRLSFKQIAEWLEAPKYSFKSSISNHVLDPAQIARYAQATVRNFCKSVDLEIAETHVEMPILISSDQRLSRDFSKKLLPYAKKIWEDLLNYEGFMRFGHDHYLKIWQLGKPTIGADFILFDEAQDADPVMLDVVNSQTNSQLIYCGDQFQAIYEWRGAKNALNMVNVDQHLWLTQSFRFGDAIAIEANDFLERLDSPKDIKGLASIKSQIKPLINPDAILCRTNAGVISALMNEQAKGRKVAIIGRTQDLIDFAEACQQLMQGGRTGHPELAPFPTWESVLGFIEEYPDEAQEIKTMVELIESFTPRRLVVALDGVVTEKNADVVISTAHRAKGREWDEVKLHGDFLHVEDMDIEDLRLAYVATTRAKISLDRTAWDSIQPIEVTLNARSSARPISKNRPPIQNHVQEEKPNHKGLTGRINEWRKK